MTYRSECTCHCHQSGSGALHIVACCQPDPEIPTYERVVQERDILINAIANAAFRVGIYNGVYGSNIGGPTALMLVDDMTEVIKDLEHNMNIKADFIEATINDIAAKDEPKFVEIGSPDYKPNPNILVPLGLYRVYWKTGGSSIAAIGMKSDGSNWIAPTNWVAPSTKGNPVLLREVERLELLVDHKDR